MNGLIVITKCRKATSDFTPFRPLRNPSLDLSIEEAQTRYFGVELDVWLEEEYAHIPGMIEGIAPLDRLPEVIEVCKQLAEVSQSSVLYLSINERILPSLSDDFKFLGYDLGYFESFYNNYSALMSEVVYGMNEVMMTFATKLNEYLLFDQLETAESLRMLRLVLLERGVRLEDDEPCVPIGVWLYQEKL